MKDEINYVELAEYYRKFLYEAAALFDTENHTCTLSELPNRVRELQNRVDENWDDYCRLAEENRRLKSEMNQMVSLDLYEKATAKSTEMLELADRAYEFTGKLPCFSPMLNGECCGCCDLRTDLMKYIGVGCQIYADPLTQARDKAMEAVRKAARDEMIAMINGVEPQTRFVDEIEPFDEEAWLNLKAVLGTDFEEHYSHLKPVTSSSTDDTIVYCSQSCTSGQLDMNSVLKRGEG